MVGFFCRGRSMEFIDILLITGLAFGVSIAVGVYIERGKMIVALPLSIVAMLVHVYLMVEYFKVIGG